MKLSWPAARAFRRPDAGTCPTPQGATILPAALPFEAGPPHTEGVGVLFCHGFTGSPTSLRPWAAAVADAGFPVSLPRLPGHGTSWQEMTRTEWSDWYACVERAFTELSTRCGQVAVAGLSMGGALALRLAETHDVGGVVLVNPAISNVSRSFAALGVVKHLRSSISSIGNDISLPGVDEASYDRTPLAPAHSMALGWRDVRRDLARVQAPVLLFTSRTDHVVDPSSAQLISEALPHTTRRWLEDSWHVATLDHDAELIQRETIEFLRGLR